MKREGNTFTFENYNVALENLTKRRKEDAYKPIFHASTLILCRNFVNKVALGEHAAGLIPIRLSNWKHIRAQSVYARSTYI